MLSDSLDAIVTPLAIGVAFLAAIGIVVWVLRRAVIATARHAAAEPLPEGWLRLLDRNVPASRALTTAERVRLLQLSRDLIGRAHWEGCRGVVVDETMQLIIAAQACLMSLRIPGEQYENVREVLIYPSTFVPRPSCKRLVWMGTPDQEPQADLGQTWADGDMVLSWDSVKAGADDPHDGQNVVYHEFAHLLADEHDLDPTHAKVPQIFGPPIQGQPDVPNPDEWIRVLSESFDRLTKRLAAGEASVLGAYAATKFAEFIAVATEVFFEKPRALRAEEPEFYAQLSAFYRQDPAATAAEPAPPNRNAAV